MVLRMESPAPPIKVDDWLRGEPLTNFQSGKVYLVEFWATGCGPCVAAMPHLVELKEKYKDRGFEVVGVAASEQAPTADEARTKLDAWLTERFPNLNYRIAFDYTGEMDRLWMEASSSLGIPTSFVVDRDGHIAFIGHPSELDDILPNVLNGSWRSSDEAKAADIGRIANNQRTARELSVTKPIYAKLQPAMQAEDWTAALSAIEEGLALMPDYIGFRETHVDLLLHKLRDMQTGLPAVRQLVEDAIDKKFEAVSWMVMALNQLFDPAMDNSHLPRAERIAMGDKLSEQILTLNPPQGDGPLKFRWYVPVAQYYYESGNKDRAIELIEVALKSLGDPETMPDHIKQYYLTPLLQALANYTGENACYAQLCVVPQNKAPENQSAIA
ncbi:MAG: TlpA family protein disulfide reductase [Mesorhizobium sp.]|uniref:TlpA disulfide reductase family protein n=1 Tax=Mesorhizobium sp. TaxID=1871066 RepID=UPI000FE8A7DB|nr:TlpA disulfide reductase family protein [Mesorhizobium sp.]RWA97935.1 MAG: TlpA family protein disulfide reductase [Mesorhizobium sp.]RWK59796.1 MAG: TlpA family protein disulfide reductase [Mesorhizobium sp.]RWM44456.1 MAG: TlpA family protein disulfide reductase [Mesorhizobium sp.]RWM49120.1 MAG: TlpA family protein disulfide reductase [Mesorhizobium sp.]RWO23202.1 MAG: TlpA family protein disulfide reductase [Mesorhizobium sp.]